MVHWVITLDRLNFGGVVNPKSSTHLPKAHFKDGSRSRVLTMSMHSRHSKGSNFLSRLGFGPLTVSILCQWFYSSLKCRRGKIRQ